jgi:hypothetical protein
VYKSGGCLLCILGVRPRLIRSLVKGLDKVLILLRDDDGFSRHTCAKAFGVVWCGNTLWRQKVSAPKPTYGVPAA